MKILQQQTMLLETSLKEVQSEQQLNQIRSQFLGKKSEITELLNEIYSFAFLQLQTS